jgi:hypothetical protein
LPLRFENHIGPGASRPGFFFERKERPRTVAALGGARQSVTEGQLDAQLAFAAGVAALQRAVPSLIDEGRPIEQDEQSEPPIALAALSRQ